MNLGAHYEDLKALARSVRADHGLETPRVLRNDLHSIFRKLGVKVDLWPPPGSPTKSHHLLGLFLDDPKQPSVMIKRGMPLDPTVFTMGHELKHVLRDRGANLAPCSGAEPAQNDVIEIGAGVFAAELIYPEGEFRAELRRRGIGLGKCTAVDLVHVKHDTKTTLSYASLAKRTERLGFAPNGTFARVQFKKLEEQEYGVPFYKQLRRPRSRFATRVGK